jgi:hypothetical protein
MNLYLINNYARYELHKVYKNLVAKRTHKSGACKMVILPQNFGPLPIRGQPV